MTRMLNDYRVGISPEMLVPALIQMAREFAASECQVSPCEVCDGFIDEWTELFEALDPINQEMVTAALSDALPTRSADSGVWE